LGVDAPVGPLQYPLSSRRVQANCHGRHRRCLLKGCERWYEPSHPQSRYCSEACQQAARRWRRWQAGRRWRATPQGRERRREQVQRHRQRQRERAAASADTAAASADIPAECEGQRPADASEDFPERGCDRPGCYTLFVVKPAQLCRRFCSVACRLALRRVLDREARYRQRRRRWRRERVTRRCHRPDTS
jgi:hypothetical protein